MKTPYMSSFPAPKKESWWRKTFVLKPGDVWEHRINDWGVWEPEVLGRWVWGGKNWIEEPTS